MRAAGSLLPKGKEGVVELSVESLPAERRQVTEPGEASRHPREKEAKMKRERERAQEFEPQEDGPRSAEEAAEPFYDPVSKEYREALREKLMSQRGSIPHHPDVPVLKTLDNGSHTSEFIELAAFIQGVACEVG